MGGLYVRIDGDVFLEKRGKIVRNDFIQTPETHWTKSQFIKNIVVFSFDKTNFN
jgi:hypothetical protein